MLLWFSYYTRYNNFIVWTAFAPKYRIDIDKFRLRLVKLKIVEILVYAQ